MTITVRARILAKLTGLGFLFISVHDSTGEVAPLARTVLLLIHHDDSTILRKSRRRGNGAGTLRDSETRAPQKRESNEALPEGSPHGKGSLVLSLA